MRRTAVSLPLLLPPLFVLLSASQSLALERSARRFSDERLDDWRTGTTTCSVAYYNICTGWISLWYGWHDGDTYGTVFDGCGNDCVLTGTYQYVWTGAPPGWGFTGTVDVETVDATDCVTGSLAQQSFLGRPGWQHFTWDIDVPARFAVMYTLANHMGYNENPASFASDGPGCGLCFPTTRTTNSYMWGSFGEDCPGTMLNDGTCNVEWLARATMICEPTVSVDDESWGSLKSLYR